MPGLGCLQLLSALSCLLAPGLSWPVVKVSGIENSQGRVQRQATGRNWTVSMYTECSSTCGGGVRVRSVRCLDEDGIIRMDCALSTRPVSFEFCNQVDCDTGSFNESILPPSGVYNFTSVGNDDATATLVFDNRGDGNYSVILTVVEPDLTVTRVQRMVDSGVDSGEVVTITPASDDVSFPTDSDQTILTVNGKDVIDLNGVDRLLISSGVMFQDGTITLLDGNILADRVRTFTYFDGLRFYCFNASLVNPLDGPGNLYINPITGEALYSISSTFNEQVDDSVRAIRNPPTTTISTTLSTATPTMPSTTPLTTDSGIDQPDSTTPPVNITVPITTDPFTSGSGTDITDPITTAEIETTTDTDPMTTMEIETTEMVLTTTTQEVTTAASTVPPTDETTPTTIITSAATSTAPLTTAPPTTVEPTTSELTTFATTETTDTEAPTITSVTTELLPTTPTKTKPITTEEVKTRAKTKGRTKTRTRRTRGKKVKGNGESRTRTKCPYYTLFELSSSGKRRLKSITDKYYRKIGQFRTKTENSRTDITANDSTRSSSDNSFDVSISESSRTDRSTSGSSRKDRSQSRSSKSDQSRSTSSNTDRSTSGSSSTDSRSTSGSSSSDKSASDHSRTDKSTGRSSRSDSIPTHDKSTERNDYFYHTIKDKPDTADTGSIVVQVTPTGAVTPCDTIPIEKMLKFKSKMTKRKKVKKAKTRRKNTSYSPKRTKSKRKGKKSGTR